MAPAQPRRRAREAAALQSRILAAAGLVALLGGIGVIVMTSGGTGGGGPALPTTTEAAPAPRPTAKPPAPVKIVVTGIGAYDPEGDQTENGGDARFATDGNAATAWKSERYRSTFSKSGVGLVVDAGKRVRASGVVVTTETPGFNAQVRVGDSPTGPFVAVTGSKATRPRTTFVLKPRRGRYLMIWITSMPAGGTAAVNEVAVTARG